MSTDAKKVYSDKYAELKAVFDKEMKAYETKKATVSVEGGSDASSVTEPPAKKASTATTAAEGGDAPTL